MALVQGRALSFVVPGDPPPQAELKVSPTGHLYYPNGKEIEAWRGVVAVLARNAKVGRTDWPVAKDVALELEVVFWLHRGKTVKRALPTVRPDLQHLVRATEDALTRILYPDDAQIVRTVSDKRYGAPGAKACTVITLRPLLVLAS